MAKQDQGTCVVTGQPAVCRGLSSTCYQSARKMIAAGETTWEELEARGLAKPARRSVRGAFREAFRNSLDASRIIDEPAYKSISQYHAWCFNRALFLLVGAF